MRTTVTLEPDTELLLRGEAVRTGASFKEVLNRAVRRALGSERGRIRIDPVFPAPFPAALADHSFNRLADEWDDEGTIEELGA